MQSDSIDFYFNMYIKLVCDQRAIWNFLIRFVSPWVETLQLILDVLLYFLFEYDKKHLGNGQSKVHHLCCETHFARKSTSATIVFLMAWNVCSIFFNSIIKLFAIYIIKAQTKKIVSLNINSPIPMGFSLISCIIYKYIIIFSWSSKLYKCNWQFNFGRFCIINACYDSSSTNQMKIFP